MGSGRYMTDRASICPRARSVSWIYSTSRNGGGRWRVAVRRGGPEAPGASVGGRAPEEAAGGEGGLGDSGHSVPGDPIRAEGPGEEDGRGRGGLFRAESGSDEVRRVLGGRLPDRQWGR